jgi:hypothetical protein
MSEINLTEQAVLVRFCGRAFGAKATDEDATRDYTSQHGTTPDASEVRNSLFPESACGRSNPYKQAVQLVGRARNFHYSQTLPFEHAWALLNSTAHEYYDNAINGFINQLAHHKQNVLLPAYPGLIEAAHGARNGTFSADDYPSDEEFLSRFSIEVQYRPVPASNHMVAKLADSRVQAIRQQLDQQNEFAVQRAVSEAWRRVFEPLLGLAQKLTKPELVVREDILDRVRSMSDLIPTWNLINDTNLQALKVQLDEITEGVTAAALKTSPILRVATAQAVTALASQFGQMGTRKFA